MLVFEQTWLIPDLPLKTEDTVCFKIGKEDDEAVKLWFRSSMNESDPHSKLEVARCTARIEFDKDDSFGLDIVQALEGKNNELYSNDRPSLKIENGVVTILGTATVTFKVGDQDVIPLLSINESLRVRISEVFERIDSTVKTVTQRVYAYFGINPGKLPFTYPPGVLRWSVNEHDWNYVHFDVHATLHQPYYVAFKENINTNFVQLMSNNRFSIGHDLLNDAWRNLSNSPRSCIVLAIASAEAGVKHYISCMSPSSMWLINNTPSPDLYKLLREYLPKLPCDALDGVFLAPSSRIVSEIKLGVETRNKIVHTGKTDDPKQSKLISMYDNRVELLNCIRDLLYLLDYNLGFSWALRHVRQDAYSNKG